MTVDDVLNWLESAASVELWSDREDWTPGETMNFDYVYEWGSNVGFRACAREVLQKLDAIK